MRCLKGEYVRPYSEYAYIAIEFQILLQVAKKGIRPTLPVTCPAELNNLLSVLWSQDLNSRPNADDAMTTLSEANHSFISNQKKWNKLREKKKYTAICYVTHSLFSDVNSNLHVCYIVPTRILWKHV